MGVVGASAVKRRLVAVKKRVVAVKRRLVDTGLRTRGKIKKPSGRTK
jgi:hypothetical protein